MTTHHYLHRSISLIMLSLLSLTCNAAGQNTTLPTVKLTVNQQSFNVEVANTDNSRTRGLSGRSALASDHGMLFSYAQPNRLSFWMIDMRFPLDIVWLDSDKRVLDLLSNAEACIGSTPCQLNGALADADTCKPGLAQSQCPILISPDGTQYALELPAGTASANHIVRGSQVSFDLNSIKP